MLIKWKSLVHLTTTIYVRRSGWITNGMQSGRIILHASAFSSLTPVPTPPEWPSQEESGSGLTASMGYGLLCGLWVRRRRTNRQPCCPPVSNPSPTPWTAWPDGSGRWDNRMAAQHLPRDLARPSSRLNNSLKRRSESLTSGRVQLGM